MMSYIIELLFISKRKNNMPIKDFFELRVILNTCRDLEVKYSNYILITLGINLIQISKLMR